MKILSDFGERLLIKRIRYLNKQINNADIFYDDSSPVSIPPNIRSIWVTTDPSPIPNLVQILGFGDYYHSGWLLAVKSISDLAAMGSLPIGILVACEFKPDMGINEFDDFFKGVIDCTKEHNCKLIGGNIKETRKSPHGVAYALGYSENNDALLRGEVAPDDVLFLIDSKSVGAFWAGIAAHIYHEKCKTLSDNTIKYLSEYCLRPKAYIKEGKKLVFNKLIKFCMDNSDGLLFSVSEIAKKSNVNILLTLKRDQLQSDVITVSRLCNSDPLIWALGWGSYQLICAASRNDYNEIKNNLNEIDFDVLEVGQIKDGNGKIEIKCNDHIYKISDKYLSSLEQFSRNSFWSHDIEEYVDKIMKMTINDIINK